MHYEKIITLSVHNWPRFHRVTTFRLDAAIFPNEGALRIHAQRRFGDGVLKPVGQNQWIYERHIPGPDWLWSFLARVLNKSYA